MQRIGIIGVGLLGGAGATRLLQRGFEVIGYDARATQVEALCLQGLRPAASVAEAAADGDEVFPIGRPICYTDVDGTFDASDAVEGLCGDAPAPSWPSLPPLQDASGTGYRRSRCTPGR